MNPQRILTHRQGRRPVVDKVILLVFFSALCLFGIVTGTAQSPAKDEREIENKIPAHLPIRVKVKNPEKVKDLKNEDWLGDLEVEVTNIGNKPIYYFYIILSLPNTKLDDGVSFGYHLRYGRIQLIDLTTAVGPDDTPLRPGESCVLKVPGKSVAGWKLTKAQHHLSEPKKAEIIFQLLNFGDGTGFIGPEGSALPIKNRSNIPCQDKKQESTGLIAIVSGHQ